jgi:hypothetical protein
VCRLSAKKIDVFNVHKMITDFVYAFGKLDLSFHDYDFTRALWIPITYQRQQHWSQCVFSNLFLRNRKIFDHEKLLCHQVRLIIRPHFWVQHILFN